MFILEKLIVWAKYLSDMRDENMDEIQMKNLKVDLEMRLNSTLRKTDGSTTTN